MARDIIRPPNAPSPPPTVEQGIVHIAVAPHKRLTRQRSGPPPVGGDTPYDAESAGKAGIRTIGVTTGGWSRQELLDAGCIEVYKDVAQLLDRFDQSALTHYGPSK